MVISGQGSPGTMRRNNLWNMPMTQARFEPPFCWSPVQRATSRPRKTSEQINKNIYTSIRPAKKIKLSKRLGKMTWQLKGSRWTDKVILNLIHWIVRTSPSVNKNPILALKFPLRWLSNHESCRPLTPFLRCAILRHNRRQTAVCSSAEWKTLSNIRCTLVQLIKFGRESTSTADDITYFEPTISCHMIRIYIHFWVTVRFW